MDIHPSQEPRLKTPSSSSFSNNCVEESEDLVRACGTIQPHGILLVLETPSLKILQVSDNTFNLLGLQPEALLGSSLSVILDERHLKTLKMSLEAEMLQALNPIPLLISLKEGKVAEFDGIVHRTEDFILLELEPKSLSKEGNYLDFYHLVREPILKFKQASSFQELCETVTREFKRLTGCDRVMVYQFDLSGNGQVLAEAKEETLTSFLGLNYPALDIPEAARNLFLNNPFRAIADIEAAPARIVPACHLDLSLSVLRGVSPCHIEYLRNMNVRASMSISIVKHQQLWGLIVCHHGTPKYLSYEVRAACELLCQTFSSELTAKEESLGYRYRLEISSLHSQLLEGMSKVERFQDALVEQKHNLLNLVSAKGAAVCSGDEIIPLGATPPLAAVRQIIDHFNEESFYKNIFQTDCLARWLPALENYKDVASGMLAVAIAHQPQKYILWFRPEILQTVCWAGNPSPQTQIGADGMPGLGPRKSFELWKETVRLTSLPWQQGEIKAARELRKAIINVVLRQADELAALNSSLQQSEARERQKTRKLKVVLHDLQQAQTQLIHNEKMSSLGQLIAGVAHELNNPVNFISGNLNYAREYAANLLDLLELYTQYYPSPPPEIIERSEGIEFEFLFDDFPKLMSSMKLGVERIERLIYSLRNFSRLDETEMQPADLHEGIDNTLIILNNRFKAKLDHPSIQLVKEYGKLPLVECYASQLNQVFMNLIANGIDALRERDLTLSKEELTVNPGTIAIRTETIGEAEVAVFIRDNGLGMPESVRKKIFEPFFTTKPVGKGTGLGLAISHQIIVEKHRGKLFCASTPGRGTEFRIEIPVTFNSPVT